MVLKNYYYYTHSIVASCSSLFCESVQKPIFKGLPESFTVIFTIMLFIIMMIIITYYLLLLLLLLLLLILLLSILSLLLL